MSASLVALSGSSTQVRTSSARGYSKREPSPEAKAENGLTASMLSILSLSVGFEPTALTIVRFVSVLPLRNAYAALLLNLRSVLRGSNQSVGLLLSGASS